MRQSVSQILWLSSHRSYLNFVEFSIPTWAPHPDLWRNNWWKCTAAASLARRWPSCTAAGGFSAGGPASRLLYTPPSLVHPQTPPCALFFSMQTFTRSWSTSWVQQLCTRKLALSERSWWHMVSKIYISKWWFPEENGVFAFLVVTNVARNGGDMMETYRKKNFMLSLLALYIAMSILSCNCNAVNPPGMCPT